MAEKWVVVLVLAGLLGLGRCSSDGSSVGNPDGLTGDITAGDSSGDLTMDLLPEGGLKDEEDEEVPDSLGETELPETKDVHEDAKDVPELHDIAEVADHQEQPDTEVEDTADILDTLDTEPEIVACTVGEPCNDGDACTLNDFCTEDGCVGTPKNCSDGLECTFDHCSQGTCSNDIKPGWCYIWGQCWQEGTANPNNPCLECITAHRKYTWSNDDTNACDDQNNCTYGDRCDAGACVGTDEDCDDGNSCTIDFCQDAQCWHQPLNAIGCDDGNVCTIGDICISGECFPGGTDRECDDFNDCTVDSCDPEDGCQYEYVEGAPCEDGDLCTDGDLCHSGVCIPGGPLNCNDGKMCTTDVCSTYIGCKHINNNLLCDDGDPCTVGDQCLGGLCKAGPDDLDCTDDNTCTQEWCAPGSGCQYLAIEADCDDMDSCTFGDHCFQGQCVVLGQYNCNDGNPCTDDICEGAIGCAHVNNSKACSDGNACTVGDQCVSGTCAAGLLPMDCFVGNPCADGFCDPELGCVMIADNDMPCDDGDACSIDDICVDGSCVGSGTQMQCNDGNPCTLDWCDGNLGCLHQDVSGICNDFNACTAGDQCKQGICTGLPISCDDGNPCTQDSCDISQGCEYSVLVTAFCQPNLVIDYPPRAAELYGPPGLVTIQGHVVHNATDLGWVKINGVDVAVQEDNTFELPMEATAGMNIIQAEAWDQYDGHDRVIQTFIMSSAYKPMNAVNPEVSQMDDGILMFLGQTVFDDDNGKPDDFASFLIYMFNSADYNLNNFVPNPLVENGDYKVKIDGNIMYDPMQLDILCIYGGLRLMIKVPNIRMHIDAESKHWYLPDVSGNVSAAYIALIVDMMLSVDADGNVVATLGSVQSNVDSLNVDLDGALGFLLNWLVDFFEGTIGGMLEDQLEGVIQDQVPQILEAALQNLAFNFDFEIPALMEGLEPTTVSLVSHIGRLEFTPAGGVLGLSAAIVTDKGVELDSFGSFLRSGCMEPEAPFALSKESEVQMAIADDVLNQVFYALWWSGLLSMPIDAELLGGGDFEEFGIQNLSMELTGLRAPLLNDCSTEGDLMVMQLGDLELDVSMVMFNMPVEVTIYATFEALMQVQANTGGGGGDGSSISLSVVDVRFVDIEIATVSENLVGSEDVLRVLIKQQLLDKLLDQILVAANASIPIPTIPLGDLVSAFPGDAQLRLIPASSEREKGYTVVSGSFKDD